MGPQGMGQDGGAGAAGMSGPGPQAGAGGASVGGAGGAQVGPDASVFDTFVPDGGAPLEACAAVMCGPDR